MHIAWEKSCVRKKAFIHSFFHGSKKMDIFTDSSSFRQVVEVKLRFDIHEKRLKVLGLQKSSARGTPDPTATRNKSIYLTNVTSFYCRIHWFKARSPHLELLLSYPAFQTFLSYVTESGQSSGVKADKEVGTLTLE